MIKNRFILLVLLLVIGSACNDWLNVSPADDISEKDLFSTGEGYRNALNGIYKTMAEYSLYGRNMTWGIPDAMGQMYSKWYKTNNSVKDLAYGAAIYDWKQDEIEASIERMWSKAYNVVANCNNIEKHVRVESDDKFVDGAREKAMILGEVLAVRAFIQFDIVRLFAPAPITGNDKEYVPYIREYPAYISNRRPTSECLDCIIEDLLEARKLLWPVDSAVNMKAKYRFEEKGKGSDRFMATRGYRLNYYAVTAALARVCMWCDKLDEALKYAQELIKYQDEHGVFDFKDQSTKGDIKLYNDVLFGLYAAKVTEWEKSVNDFSDPYNYYCLNILNIKQIFYPDLKEVEDYDTGIKVWTSSDHRYKNYVEDYKLYGSEFVLKKYREQTQNGYQAEVSNGLIPMIRMSEMYYIVGEILALNDDIDGAIEYLFKVKKGRGMKPIALRSQANSIYDYESFMEVLLRDARREFIGEGQIFFMHKRLDLPMRGDAVIVYPEESKYVIPLPKTETNLK